MNTVDIYNKYKSLNRTTGQKLIDAFDLTQFGKMSIVIQKVISSSKNIFIITYDSRYPKRIITFNDLKKIKGNNIHKLKLYMDLIIPKKIRLSMPLYLNKFNSKLPTDSYIITRDLMGRERLRNNELFENYTVVDIEENKIQRLI